ncbi:MAG TPA: hypothetical protein DHV85_25470 [Candidatus Accumulibacter sp.]|nr:hypothetical protein [Accumulibacter sp.]
MSAEAITAKVVGVTTSSAATNSSLIQSAWSAPALVPITHTTGTVAMIPRKQNRAQGTATTHQREESVSVRTSNAAQSTTRMIW